MPTDCEPRNVLIVDDDEDIIRMLAIFLGSRGYTCRSARTGAQAAVAFNLSRVRLVITDLNMPAGDGIALIDRIRRTSQVPIIVVTAFTPQYTARLAPYANVTVLSKPFSSTKLLELVEAGLLIPPPGADGPPDREPSPALAYPDGENA